MSDYNEWLYHVEKSLTDSGCICSRMTIEAAARAAERLLKVELERQIHAGRDYHEELIEENSIPSYAEFDAIGPWMKRIRVRLSKETASVVEYYLPDIAKAALDVHRKIIAETAAAPTAAAEPGPTDASDATKFETWRERTRPGILERLGGVAGENLLNSLAEVTFFVHRDMIAEIAWPKPAAEPVEPAPDRAQILLSEIAMRLRAEAVKGSADGIHYETRTALRMTAEIIESCTHK